MPNWLGDLVMGVTILISLVKERPDVRFVLFCRSQYKEFLESLNIFSEVIIVKDVFSFFPLSTTYLLDLDMLTVIYCLPIHSEVILRLS